MTQRSPFTRDDVREDRVEILHDGFFHLRRYHLSHSAYHGAPIGPMTREMLLSAEAMIVLPYDPALGRVLLVEQFRTGAWAAGAQNPWLLEAPAGRIDAGETPEDAARREAAEEAGVALTDLHKVAQFYSTPGTASERLHGFIGRADLSAAGGYFGLAEETEDVRAFTLSIDEALAAADSGALNTGPTLLLLFALLRKRADLDAAWGG